MAAARRVHRADEWPIHDRHRDGRRRQHFRILGPCGTPECPTPPATAEATTTPTPTPTAGPTETPVATERTPVPTGTPSGKAIQGDTDCDGDVDSVDGLFVLRDVAGFDPSECIEQGDVDCDEDRDSVDALGILRDVAALPPLVQQEPCADIGTPL